MCNIKVPLAALAAEYPAHDRRPHVQLRVQQHQVRIHPRGQVSLAPRAQYRRRRSRTERRCLSDGEAKRCTALRNACAIVSALPDSASSPTRRTPRSAVTSAPRSGRLTCNTARFV